MVLGKLPMSGRPTIWITTNQPKLPVPRRPTNLDYSRARAYCACSRCGWGLFGHFSLIYHFSFLSPSFGWLVGLGLTAL